MKKTCNGCRALNFEGKDIVSCSLQFKFDHERFVPLEECTKPMTVVKLADELRNLNRKLRD